MGLTLLGSSAAAFVVIVELTTAVRKWARWFIEMFGA